MTRLQIYVRLDRRLLDFDGHVVLIDDVRLMCVGGDFELRTV